MMWDLQPNPWPWVALTASQKDVGQQRLSHPGGFAGLRPYPECQEMLLTFASWGGSTAGEPQPQAPLGAPSTGVTVSVTRGVVFSRRLVFPVAFCVIRCKIITRSQKRHRQISGGCASARALAQKGVCMRECTSP